MKMLARAGALLCALTSLIAFAVPAAAQSDNVGKEARLPAGYAPGTVIYCDDGTGHVALCSFAGGGGGGGGDASAANQTSQITAATLTNTRLGDITSPANGSVNARLEAVRALLAGTLTTGLPTGAATSALQTTGNGSLSTIATNTGAGRDSGGRLLPGQGIAGSTYFASLTTSAATQLVAAASTRIGLSVQFKAALTADVYLCTTQTTSCSATSYDAQVPSGAAAGTTYTFLFAPSTSVYYFTTATASGVVNSWTAQ